MKTKIYKYSGKEENIVVQIKDEKKGIKELIPNKSLGIFILGSSIKKYVHLPHDLAKNEVKYFSYDSYNFYELGLIVWVEKGKVETVCCKNECYWRGYNLLKMPIDKFQSLYNVMPDKSEKIYHLVNGRGQNQMVYDFDKLGLQIWVWRKKIVTVLVSNYEACD